VQKTGASDDPDKFEAAITKMLAGEAVAEW
jgi:hypothetical protein